MRLFLLSIFISFFAVLSFASSETNSVAASSKTVAPGVFDFDAESINYYRNGWAHLQNNVVVRYGDMQLTADSVKLNPESGELVAEGNVVLIRDNFGAIRTKKISFNFKTGEGLSSSIDIQSGRFRVVASSTQRSEKNSYYIKNPLVTTCTNDLNSLHYSLTARDGEYMPNQYVQMHGAVPRFLGLPLFYFPIARRSLQDHFGWSFIPGYESDWGAYLLTSYRTQLIDLGGPFNDSINSKTHLDYRSDRGFALGEDISWSFGEKYNGGSRGMVGIYGIFDDDPMGEDLDRYATPELVEDTRYRATLRHDTYFSPSDYLTIRSSYLSDSYVFSDFYEDEYEDYLQPESYISYMHSSEYILLGLNAYYQVNKFYDSINRYPELTLDVNLIELGESGIYYESETQGAFLQKHYAEYDEVVPTDKESILTRNEDYEAGRIDTLHTITYPFKSFGFLNVVPRVGYRGTYYSKTKESRTEEYADAASTNTLSRTVITEGDAELRSLFDIGTEISFKAYGFYRGEDNFIYRHTLEPYINWTYIPEPNLRPDDLYQFDSIDKLDKGHYARFGLRQLLDSKNGDSKIREVFDIDLYGVYYFEDANDYSGIKYYGADITWMLTDSIKIDADALYDADEGELDHIDFWMALWRDEHWEASGQVYYIPEVGNDSGTTLFKGNLRYNFNDAWSFGAYARYDSAISRCEKVAGYLQYNTDCISFRFRTEFEPSFTRDDGTERESKIHLGFNVWVREFTPSKYEKKLRNKHWDD